jgi:hypothetical protein
MSLETGFWRIQNNRPMRIAPTVMDYEKRLEEVLESDIAVVSEPRRWMVIGRQVQTDHGGFIDLLAMDETGNLVVLELKRDKSDREVVSQVLDYASWVQELEYEGIASIFATYQDKWHNGSTTSLQEAFNKFFGVDIPEEVNGSHEMVIVATELHPESERVVRYLQKNYAVPVNAVFFSFFLDGDAEYLSRSWLVEPTNDETALRQPSRWNGEYYVTFGYPKDVVQAGLKYGFFVAGGGEWFWKSMDMLSIGDHVWVYLPTKYYGDHNGFVGLAEVLDTRQPVDNFTVTKDGAEVPIASLFETPLAREADDPATAEYVVRLKWLSVRPETKAVWEKGFFANQNTVTRPVSPKWDYTVNRLKTLWGIDDECLQHRRADV